MRDTCSIRLDQREAARVAAASAEAGVPAATFLREAAVEVADLVLAGLWRPARREPTDGRVVEFVSCQDAQTGDARPRRPANDDTITESRGPNQRLTGEQAPANESEPEQVGVILRRMLEDGKLPALREALFRQTPDAA